MPATPIIETKSLNIYHRSGNIVHRKNYIIRDFNTKINKGEVTGLSGSSGIGKTTLGKTILNLHKYWDGEIFWNGGNIKNIETKPVRHLYNWMGQEPSLTFNPVKKIRITINETLKVSGMRDLLSRNNIILEMCSKYRISEYLLDRFPFELSAGQIQRFALMRILLLKPVFIVLDEPTSSLDPINQLIFLENIEKFRQENELSILFISHSKKLLQNICDKIIELK